MKISLNWLKKYAILPKNLDPREFVSKLTLATVEVDGYENLATNLENIFVGKIIKILPHSNAEKLRLVDVEIKKEIVRVVCGGTNLTEGMFVALALPGAKVRWHGEGELITLAPAKIRGEESFGMICASSEIGLADLFESKDGEILDLSERKLTCGQSLAQALKLDDLIIEIDNKSITNRPDLWGHYGLAREAAAIYKVNLESYKTEKIKEEKEIDLAVEVADTDLCLRYLAVEIENIKVGPSPEWLVKSLQSVGLNSINNIVDVTNYILFDLGQPMHAFDAELVDENNIFVRRASRNEKIVTLDGVERVLGNDNLVIADRNKVLALAGIMGAEISGIKETTSRIILESATFDAYNIRKTGQEMGLRTEASMRYEKSLDPQMARSALEKAVEIILELCPQAKVVSKVVDVFENKPAEKLIETTYEFLTQRIGSDIEKTVINETLERLGFELKKKNGELKVLVPSWRATKDVSIAEDLVEEVARMFGYDNLSPVMPKVALSLAEDNKIRQLEREIKNYLVEAVKADELCNYSFVSREQLEKMSINPNDHIEVANPITEENSLMRQSLLPNLLKCAELNLRFFEEINIFEAGRVFLPKAGLELIKPGQKKTLPDQPIFISGVYAKVDNHEPFYQARATGEFILKKLNIKFTEKIGDEILPFAHPQRFWRAEQNGEILATVGEFHPQVLKNFGLNCKVAFWQINLTKLADFYQKQYVYEEVAKYPGIELDLAILVNEKVAWKDIKNLVLTVEPNLIKEIKLFDVYKNDKMESGDKSLAFHILYQSPERTLEMKEVQKLQEKVIEQLKKAVGAQIRS
jgi:phenylalanyl-tRNA synthetase beta chain